MAIVLNLDVMMAKRKIGLAELAAKIDLTQANLSVLKNNKAKAIRFSTLEAICRELDCQPGDILEYRPDMQNSGSINTAGPYDADKSINPVRPDNVNKSVNSVSPDKEVD